MSVAGVIALLFGAVLLVKTGSGQSTNVHYAIIAPSIIRPSSVYSVTATSYNVVADVALRLRIESPSGTDLLAETQLTLTNGVTRIANLTIPESVPLDSYRLLAIGSGGWSISDSRYVSVKRKTLSIFIQTDKAMYKPGQKVLFRVVVVTPSLLPYPGPFDFMIFDQSDNRIMQWLNQRSDSGVISQSLQLSDQTPVGQWKIVAFAGGNNSTKTFQVAEYVLPKFDAVLTLPPFYPVNLNRRDRQKDLKITVTAKYTFGQPVNGRAVVTIQLKFYEYEARRNISRITKDVQLVDGKADTSVRIDELVALLNDYNYYYGEPWYALSYRSIVVSADVNETLTGIVRSTNVTVPCTATKYQLKFPDNSPENFKPGLTYTAVLRLTQFGGSNPDAEDITQAGNSPKTVSLRATMRAPGTCLSGSPGCPAGPSVPCPPCGPSGAPGSSSVYCPGMPVGPPLGGPVGVPGPVGPSGPSGPFGPTGPIVTPTTTPLPIMTTNIGPNGTPSAPVTPSSPGTPSAPPGTTQIPGAPSAPPGTTQTPTVPVGPTASPGTTVLRLTTTRPNGGIGAPGLPYYPYYCPGPPGVPVTYSQVVETRDLTASVGADGYAVFSVPIGSNINAVTLEASFYDEGMNLNATASRSLSPFVSRDNQSIQITCADRYGSLKPRQYTFFNVTTREPITTFYYEVFGKGNIVLSGKVVRSLSTQVSFDIALTEDEAMRLAPSARIVVWLLTNLGEVIVDSIQLPVQDAFANKVNLTFDRNLTTPAQKVSLSVSAYKYSNVFLTAVDQSVRLLQSGNDVTKDTISSDLMGYDSVNAVPYMSFGYYYYPFYYYSVSGTTSYSILNNAGVLFMTDGYVNSYVPREPIYPPIGMPGPSGSPGAPGAGGTFTQPALTFLATSIQRSSTRNPNDVGESGNNLPKPPEEPRINFPETWIWTDDSVGDDGNLTTTYTVPDSITSWVAGAFAMSQIAGLGVAEEAKLTVFKQFFISPTLPYSIIRGEEFALKVLVMNYLSTDLTVTVTVEQSNYLRIQGSASTIAYVKSNDASSVFFWIIPLTLGQIPISIRASSPAAADSVIVTLLVKPEGKRQQYSSTMLIQLQGTGATFYNKLNVSLPPPNQLVPGSESIIVTAGGDLLVSTIKGLSSLLVLPTGCGEQTMSKFAPNVYVLKYLTATNQLTPEINNMALSYITTGYQRELTFQQSDGSYTFFYGQNVPGSVWLCTLVVKLFHQAKKYIAIDDANTARTVNWVISAQLPNGSFADTNRQSYLRGGLSEGVPLTAFVLIGLIENQDNQQVSRDGLANSIARAKDYLEKQLPNITTDRYALSIVAYALARAGSSLVTTALEKLEALAIVKDGTRHWEQGLNDVTGGAFWSPPYVQAKSIDIELTSYALLTYCYLKKVDQSLAIAKWIVQQRNAQGGFSSTQDTILALESLALFAELTHSPSAERNLRISLSSDTENYSFRPITNETAFLLQSYEFPSNTRTISVNATGAGSAIVQLSVMYNVYETSKSSSFSLDVNVTQIGNTITVKSCSSWTKEEDSGMVLMEVNKLTGFQASTVNTDDVIRRAEDLGDKVVLYLDRLTPKGTCVNVDLEKTLPVRNVKDAPVTVYRYYEPSSQYTRYYSAPQNLGQNSECTECPLCCNPASPTTTKSRRTTPPSRQTPSRQTQPRPSSSSPSPSVENFNSGTTPRPLNRARGV